MLLRPLPKGMPILDAADQSDFLRPALTSCNVRGGWLTDFALGGLNYQIEHHLFPSWLCSARDGPICERVMDPPRSEGEWLR